MKHQTRDIYFDNLKSVLIILVVLGHITNLNRTIPLIGAVNNVIYSFHMPIFIFVSGYFSKNITSQRSSEIEKILYPYLIFQVLNYAFTLLTGLGRGSINVFMPAYQNWYLLGLFFWRLLIPYCNFYDKKYTLLFAIVLAFVVGFFDEFNSFFGLYRIIYFFPIFIIGYYCPDLHELLQKTSKYKFYFISFSVLCLAVIFLLSLYSSKINSIMWKAYTPATNYGHSFYLLSCRVIAYISSLAISIGLLYLIPTNKLKITYIGENTMSIFLLHMFFVFSINNYLAHLSAYILLVVSIIVSLLICLILSNRLLNQIISPFIDMKKLRTTRKATV